MFLGVSPDSTWCGYFGPDTRKKLREQASSHISPDIFKKAPMQEQPKEETILVQDTHASAAVVEELLIEEKEEKKPTSNTPSHRDRE